MSTTTMEEVFKAGWNAYEKMLHDGSVPDEANEAWEDYRYNQLLRISGKEIADEWLAARKASSDSKPQNLKCPDCQGEMLPRSSQYGKFWGCKAYPRCKGTRDSEGMSKAERAAQKTINSPEHEDIGPDTYKPEQNKGFTFNKK